LTYWVELTIFSKLSNLKKSWIWHNNIHVQFNEIFSCIWWEFTFIWWRNKSEMFIIKKATVNILKVIAMIIVHCTNVVLGLLLWPVIMLQQLVYNKRQQFCNSLTVYKQKRFQSLSIYILTDQVNKHAPILWTKFWKTFKH
jgi:hypothetical protein